MRRHVEGGSCFSFHANCGSDGSFSSGFERNHAGGLRKVRLRLPGRGKSGGSRVIYLYLERHDAIVFFYAYTKAKSENLTADQLKRLRNAVAVIKQEFKP